MFNLLKYLKPYWRHVILVLILVLLQSLSQLFLPTLMADIVDKVLPRVTTPQSFAWGHHAGCSPWECCLRHWRKLFLPG